MSQHETNTRAHLTYNTPAICNPSIEVCDAVAGRMHQRWVVNVANMREWKSLMHHHLPDSGQEAVRCELRGTCLRVHNERRDAASLCPAKGVTCARTGAARFSHAYQDSSRAIDDTHALLL